MRTASVIALLLALTVPVAATPPKKSKALTQRLRSLSELTEARAAALTIINDSTRYVKGDHTVQREVNQATARVEKAHARVESLLRGDLRKLTRKKKKARQALNALQTAPPERLNAWERLLLQRLADVEVMTANASLLKELPKTERPSTHQLEQLRLTNEYRMLMGLRALKFEQHLEQAAQSHSEEMVRLRYFDHTSPNEENKSPFMRAKKAGFTGFAVGENIAKGYRSPKSVHKGWLTSPGHHRNIVVRDWEVMGVAHSRDHWTQVFGKVTRDDETATK